MARVPQIAGKADVPEPYHHVVDQVQAVFGGIRGPFSILLHSPELAERMLRMVTFNRDKSVVEGKARSLAILATVREREAAYVWSAQVAAARRNGLREGAIDVLRARGDADALRPEEREIVTYARQLAQTNKVDQAAFDTLQKKYGTKWLVELTVLANYFGALSATVNAFEVPAPADGDRF